MRRNNYFLPLILLALFLLVGVVSADTLIVYPSSDLRVSRVVSSENFATITGGAGTESTTAANSSVTLASGTGAFTTSRRYIMVYNGSAIPDTAIITSVVLRIYATPAKAAEYGTTNFGMVLDAVNPTSLTGLQTSDYNKFVAGVNYSVMIPYTSWTYDTNQNFTLTNTTVINKTGLFPIGMRNWWDHNATFQGTFATSASNYMQFAPLAYTGTTYDPYLEVTYELPDTTPPGAIQGLSNDTSTCEQIIWGWQSPSDADFNHTMVYKDGIFLYNLSNTTYEDTWTGLTGGQEYTFSSRTCDLTGNCNETFVNMTAIPTTCGVAPVASFTSNVTSGTAPLDVGFTDTSSNTPTAWNYSFRNETPGNNTEIWWSTEQNPVITLGVGNWFFALNASNAFGFDVTGDDYWINVTEPVPFTACKDQAGNLTINLSNVTDHSLGFDWDIAYNLTQLSFDAYFIDFDNSSSSYFFSGLQAESWHRVKIYNLTENGSMNCTTNVTVIIPPPWSPDINPSTEKDFRIDTVFSKALDYWWIILLIAGAWILFRKS